MSAGTRPELALDDDFISNYYQHLAPEDRASYKQDELRRRIRAHWSLAATRHRGTALVSIDNEPDASVLYVVTDDMPFLVDSVVAEVARAHAAIRQVSHPTFIVTRDSANGELIDVEKVPAHTGVSSGDTAAMPQVSARVLQHSGNGGPSGSVSTVESWIAVEMATLDSDGAAEHLIERVRKVLSDVDAAVEDYPAMTGKLLETADYLDQLDGVDDAHSGAELLRWLAKDNFTLIAYREHDLVERDGEDVLVDRPGTGLGVLRSDTEDVHHLTRAGRHQAREKHALVITKANSRSTVHRPVWLDYIGVKDFNAAGEVIGERLFLGVLAAGAFTGSIESIPVVREKVDAVLKYCGFPPDSHSGKDLRDILESYPREELFQIGTDDLTEIALGIMRLQERRRTRLFLRADTYGRFVSALVYLPRDRYTTPVRRRIEQELIKTFGAESIDFEVRMSESVLARLFFRIRLPRGQEVPDVDVEALQSRIKRAARSWSEGIEEVLRERTDLDEVNRLAGQWSEAFPAQYRAQFEIEDALNDIALFTRVEQTGQAQLELAQVVEGIEPTAKHGESRGADARLRIYTQQALPLSQLLPVFHNMGLQVTDERPFDVVRADGTRFVLYDLGLMYPETIDPSAGVQDLADAFRAAISGALASDRFERLILAEGLTWRQVLILRTYARYLRQLGNTNSYGYIADTLLANPDVAHGLVALFEARFDPQYGAVDDERRVRLMEQARDNLAAALDDVSTLDADRLLRTMSELLEASVRTNFYQYKPYVSVKLTPQHIAAAPAPRPMWEIWVYSPQVEGVHLRFGSVARGGLRWSDRQEDFRTEVLGLVKAQTVKNAVIVPTGAKGGFYPQNLPDPTKDRAGWMEAGREAYKSFIRALLDVTDNRVQSDSGTDAVQVIGPPEVVSHDGEDSYLVVAADKGTATFSDTANAISAEYGFWLGDAFASGGSVGYDHKAMGITARGAWESVRAHFKELGVDTQSDDFTVVGVGDMSGDVFGNGMLLSEHIRLLAAFDHRHIFLDPNPDPAVSFAERQRMFELPRSSWADYDDALISEGGGVYPRSAKSIPLSPQVREILDIDDVVLSPPELIRAILRAPVDLFYNGGIGTYIKASDETNASVGDKANDAIRINGDEVRVRVIGEGGNLGATQRGRVEAALSGVILNTDAIDNSAGVDCSDHEVNIKILVDSLVRSGALDAGERAQFLESMTDEVGELVLRDNRDQNLLLFNDKQNGAAWAPSFERHMQWLETHADLDRDLEFLPSTEQMRERISEGRGLTSPELSVLAAYAKIQLTGALLRSDVPDDPWFDSMLLEYFPTQIRERFAQQVATHPLRREIIATRIANDMVNIGGITFAFRAMEETGTDEASVARAFSALRRIFGLDEFVQLLVEVPAAVPTETQAQVYSDMRRLLDRAVRWFINHGYAAEPVGEAVDDFAPVVDPLQESLGQYLRGVDRTRTKEWMQRALELGLPQRLASRWSSLFETYALLDVAELARQSERDAGELAQVYFAVYDRFDVDMMLERITNLPREDRWQALARAALREDLYSTVADITLATLEATEDMSGEDGVARVARWEQLNTDRLERVRTMFNEATERSTGDMASLSVALRLLRSIVRR